jgi:hypothetical protein
MADTVEQQAKWTVADLAAALTPMADSTATTPD